MDLPDSVIDLGERLRGEGAIVPDPALFSDPQVFAAERERIFQRCLLALDHETRLSEAVHWFRCDAPPRSILVTKGSGGRLHALRNVCIHAGYPVCDAEEGAAERLICPYHGWEYALDGKLVEPELSSRIDPSRLRLRSYPVCVVNGLILVDGSGASEVVANPPNSLPAWLSAARVVRRTRYVTQWNWKYLHRFLHSSPQLLLAGAADHCHEFGLLSWVYLQSGRAVLLRIIPKFAEQTDVQVIEMIDGEAAHGAETDTASDLLTEQQLRNAEPSPSWFDRDFAQRYWVSMSAVE
jgi:nitrite reductase/ring-hydroxylating ferredoxin subunit